MSDKRNGPLEQGSPAPPDACAEVAAAAAGLLMPSESDHPFEPFRWPGPGPLTPDALVAHLGLPPATRVETRGLDSFFDPLAAVRDWGDAAQRASAARFALLRDRCNDLLASAMVYRVGVLQVTVIIAGAAPDGAVCGLRTTVVET